MERTLFETEHEMFRDSVRGFIAKELVPHHEQWEHDRIVPREVFAKAGAQGFLGMAVPEELGGGGVADFRYNVVIAEEVQRAGVNAAGLGWTLHNDICLPYFLTLCTPEQQQRWLPGICSGELITAIAMTEPGIGSDLASMTTSAVLDGDHYVVNGSKTFITSGMRADYLTTAVRTGVDGPAGISLLLIEGDRPGVDRTKLDKMGWLASDTATLYFDDVRVPVDNLITEEDAGFSAIVNNFNAERIDLAVQSTAFSRVCFEEALAWARERETFGKRLADHQVIRHKLAEMDRMINASKAWLELLSWRLNRGDNPVAEIAEAKVNATLCFEHCAREAAQILGGASYLRGDTVERLYREVRVQAIGGGSEEIMRDLASRQLGI